MTKSELNQYVEAYSVMFRGWIPFQGEGFVRVSGPIAQQVWFDNLRSGAYRPVSAVSILVAKGGAMLHQFLDLRNREIFPREHNSVFERVCKAMKEQFVPSIVAPLDAKAVCDLCEKQAVERVNDAHSLSALHAYFGNAEAARRWIGVVTRLTNGRNDLEEWEKERLDDCKSLATALERDDARSYLESIRLSEESRFMGSWGGESEKRGRNSLLFR